MTERFVSKFIQWFRNRYQQVKINDNSPKIGGENLLLCSDSNRRQVTYFSIQQRSNFSLLKFFLNQVFSQYQRERIESTTFVFRQQTFPRASAMKTFGAEILKNDSLVLCADILRQVYLYIEYCNYMFYIISSKFH